MKLSEQLKPILNRIEKGQQTEEDINVLPQLLRDADRLVTTQLAKYNVNLGEGRDIHIGDRTYYDWDEKAIKALVKEIKKFSGIYQNTGGGDAAGRDFNKQETNNFFLFISPNRDVTNNPEKYLQDLDFSGTPKEIIQQVYQASLDENLSPDIPVESRRQEEEIERLQREEEEIDREFSFEIITVNAKGEEINRQPGSARQKVENLAKGVTLEMVYIPGGSFTMGSPENEEERESDESPQHQVEVSAFYLGKYPVTQAQYQGIMGKNPSRFKGKNRPVENVSWDDAVEFCRRLSEKTGKTYRLPSEAQWEYACRAGTTTPFHFGETLTPDLANYYGNDTYASGPKGVWRQETTDVGSFPPNAFGLYDIHGNVWEWCQDVLHENYSGAPRDGSAWESGGDSYYRLQRGASWNDLPGGCRSAYRLWRDAGCRLDSRGFRVVLLPGV